LGNVEIVSLKLIAILWASNFLVSCLGEGNTTAVLVLVLLGGSKEGALNALFFSNALSVTGLVLRLICL
jgi:hypothetical protein